GRFAFAEISPQDTAFLDDAIRALPDALAKRGVPWLGRSLEALAGHIEQPAVESAAQPAAFEPAEGEIGAAMCAVAIDQAVAALLVAKQHQILAEQFHRPHRPRPLQLIHQRRRLPIHPHQLPARILRADAGDRSFCSWLIMALTSWDRAC